MFIVPLIVWCLVRAALDTWHIVDQPTRLRQVQALAEAVIGSVLAVLAACEWVIYYSGK